MHLFSFLKKMPPALLSALVITFIVLASVAWGSGHLFAFFSFEGLLIVGGGTVGVAFMSYNRADVEKSLRAVQRLFQDKGGERSSLHQDMLAIIYCARLLREKGMRSLESIIAQSGLRDPFVKYGFNMAVSQYPPEDVRAMMETAATAHYERESVPVEILHAMASHAPAFGMVGTLVGMVAMLSHLSADITLIGANLALSFLSTLYGVLSARLIYLPAASKMQQDLDHTRFRHYLITEGMVMLVAGKNPMFIQDRLNSYLSQDSHDYIDVLDKESARLETDVEEMRAA